MLRELLSIFRASDPLSEMGENFRQMLQLAYDMNVAAGEIFFGEGSRQPGRERIYEWDSQVNELERVIRRQVVTHLSVKGNEADLPYSLLLISLVKDVERLGDYAKNLSEIVDIRPDPLPDGLVVTELRAIRARVEHAFRSCADVFVASRREEAVELIRQGRETARRCDRLVADIGHGDHDAATTTALILGTRYYKRIGGHVLNVLSSVVMPLDRVDYYDESDAFPGATARES
jgi:phosphate uptake regulator